MQLRPYQTEALEAVRASYRRGHRRALVVMPTGTGKTVLFAEIARLAKGPVLVLAHRQELVEQAREKIAQWCDDDVAVEMAERRELTQPARAGGRTKIAVASVQTIRRRLASLPRDAFRIVVVDEAHHATADSYRAILDHFTGHVLGVTATPDRADDAKLGEVFDDLAFEYDMRTAIDDGWLVPIRSFLVQTRADFSNVRKVAGELSVKGVERVLTRDLHLAEIAEPVLRERKGRKAIVFAASVAHAHALARVMNQLVGHKRFAAALDGTASLDRRAPVIQRFRSGETQILVNCSLFTEGFDVPEISLVAIARPILSRPFYAQMVGRGTRIATGKRDLLVLDFVPGNCRHRLVQAVDIFATGSEELAECAREVTAKASAEGRSIGVEEALELARQVQEAREADVVYQLKERDPFASIGIDLSRFVSRSRDGDRATAKQLAYFKRAGLHTEELAGLSAEQAEALREELLDRKAVGLCSPREARQLVLHGIDPRDMYQDEAKAILRELKAKKRGVTSPPAPSPAAELDLGYEPDHGTP